MSKKKVYQGVGKRLTKGEIDKRIKKAYDLRYNQNYGQIEYVKWCKEHYGDKSEQTYCKYFLEAKSVYDANWKDMLQRQLSPAVKELRELMMDKDPKVRQRAIDQVFKYTGNDIQKVESNIKGDMNINVSFGGSDEE